MSKRPLNNRRMLHNQLALMTLRLAAVCLHSALAMQWDHSVHLSPEYRMMWNVKHDEVTFEVQVRTLGYVGLGFSRDGSRSGADLAIGWIDRGQTYFQDRHMKRHGTGDSAAEPLVDPSQDYELTLGYENATHTVLRFKRKLDTCDTSHDISITNDTMRILYMFHDDEPAHGSVLPGSLPNPTQAFRGYVPLMLTQRITTLNTQQQQQPSASTSGDSNDASQPLHTGNAGAASATSSTTTERTMELRNQDVELPQADETRFWCKMFELQDFRQKHHLIKYEPIFDSGRSRHFLQHIIVYGCQGHSATLESMSRQGGHVCANRNNPSLPCNAIIASWTRGSEGFAFPPEAGYPFESTAIDRFYLMESHYNNPNPDGDLAALHLGPVVDNSGLKLFFTTVPRKHDAGVISIGMDPNWRHIIPPRHEKVISEGHCNEDCTRKAFPATGIAIFAVLMQTHSIGKEIRLRLIRKNEELLPIAVDAALHPGYAEHRRVEPAVRVLPGDNLVAECVYNSSLRDAITLGGLTRRGETCNVMAVYYPRQRKLSTCHSLPSLPTVLHSLGIQELALNSQPVIISSPPSLAGMTLEERLMSYDWQQQFDSFQRVTRTGSFRAMCLDPRNQILKGTETRDHFSPVVTKYWRTPHTSECPSVGPRSSDDPLTTSHLDTNNVYVTELATRRKSSHEAEVESMSLSAASSIGILLSVRIVAAFLLLLRFLPNVFVIT